LPHKIIFAFLWDSIVIAFMREQSVALLCAEFIGTPVCMKKNLRSKHLLV